MDTQEDIRIKLDIEIETQSNIVKTLKIQKADKKLIMTELNKLLLLKSQLAANGGPIRCTCLSAQLKKNHV